MLYQEDYYNMSKYVIDTYKDCQTKKVISVSLTPEMLYWIDKLVTIEIQQNKDITDRSKAIRYAIHLMLKYRFQTLYRCDNDKFRRENERTGKIFNQHRY